MILGNQTSTSYTTVIQVDTTVVQAHILRRQLQAELLELKDLLGHTRLDDEMTNQIRKWHQTFFEELNPRGRGYISVDEQSILDESIDTLKEILKSPLVIDFDNEKLLEYPLEEISYLGSDGETYGEKALCIYLSRMPAGLAGKSPASPNLDTQFTVTPHPVVRAVAEWLRKQGSPLEIDPEVEQGYRELVASNTLPELPTPERIRSRNLFQERVRLLNAENAQREVTVSFTVLPREDIASRVRRSYAGVFTQIEENNASADESSEAIGARDVQMKNQVEIQIAQLDQEINQINTSIASTEKKLENVDGKLSDQEIQMHKTRLAIERHKAAIKRWKKRRKYAIIRTIPLVMAAIGLCFVCPPAAKLFAGAACFTVAPALESRPKLEEG